MKAVGFLFPGQGAQYVGMGKDLYTAFPEAKNIFEQADRILGYSISELCFQGPEETLTKTAHAQPAIFVTSIAVLAILKKRFPQLTPSFVAGLSLGEFTALVAARSIRFEDGLRLVSVRAEAMEKAATRHPGTMASILGLSEDLCQQVAEEAGCQVANLNSPDQIVLSGTIESIEKACVLAEARGAKRAIRLKVGGAFHSSLMKDAKEDLEAKLRATEIKQPICTFVPNVTAASVGDPEEIRSLLARQLMNPVQWIQTMRKARETGLTQFLEVGPGKVLKGLAKKSQPELHITPCGTCQDIEHLDGQVQEKIEY